MVFDDKVKQVITSAYYSGEDVFLEIDLPVWNELIFDSLKTVVLLPGLFYGFSKYDFSDIGDPPEDYSRIYPSDILFCDARFMGEEIFRDFLRINGYRRIIIPFADCADDCEYGFCRSYGWVGEFRAETVDFCQIVAFFSPVERDYKPLTEKFLSPKVVCLRKNYTPTVYVHSVTSQIAGFYHTAAEAEKYGYEKVCIFFNTRNEVHEFSAFLNKRGTAHLLFDGSLDVSQRREVLQKYLTGDICILVSTKSVIHETLFFNFDKCIFCGMPFSLAHLYRCAGVTSSDSILVVTSEKDYNRNRKILSFFADCAENEQINKIRHLRLDKIKLFLERGM